MSVTLARCVYVIPGYMKYHGNCVHEAFMTTKSKGTRDWSFFWDQDAGLQQSFLGLKIS